MRFSSFAALASLAAVANAHFQLQFPSPRGKFVEDDEPTFCGMLERRTTFWGALMFYFVKMATKHTEHGTYIWMKHRAAFVVRSDSCQSRCKLALPIDPLEQGLRRFD